MAQECKGHEKHMCELTKAKKMGEVKKLAKGANYVCAACGRAAASSENLCKPEKAGQRISNQRSASPSGAGGTLKASALDSPLAGPLYAFAQH